MQVRGNHLVKVVRAGLIVGVVLCCGITAGGGSTTRQVKPLTVVAERGEDEGGVITVKVVDRDGKAVVGAGVYQWYSVHEGRKATAEFVCNEDGVVNLPSGEVFKYERQEEAMLYGLWEDKLAGFVKVSRGDVDSEVELRLEQACRVYGELKSSTLAELGQEIEWTTVYLFVDNERPMSCMGKQTSYEFFVPAGEYKLYGYGARSYGVQKEIVVSAGQAELEAELDFPAYRLAYLIGKKTPELSKIKGWINTEAIMLSSLNGKVVLLDFWGWWCGPCVGSMPKLMDLHEKYHEKGLVIIAVHDDSLDSVDMLRDKLTELKDDRWDGREIPFAVALDGGGNTKIEGTTRSASGATTAAYGIQAWPTMVLIDKEGKVVGRYDRRDTELLEKLLGI